MATLETPKKLKMYKGQINYYLRKDLNKGHVQVKTKDYNQKTAKEVEKLRQIFSGEDYQFVGMTQHRDLPKGKE